MKIFACQVKGCVSNGILCRRKCSGKYLPYRPNITDWKAACETYPTDCIFHVARTNVPWQRSKGRTTWSSYHYDRPQPLCKFKVWCLKGTASSHVYSSRQYIVTCIWFWYRSNIIKGLQGANSELAYGVAHKLTASRHITRKICLGGKESKQPRVGSPQSTVVVTHALGVRVPIDLLVNWQSYIVIIIE